MSKVSILTVTSILFPFLSFVIHSKRTAASLIPPQLRVLLVVLSRLRKEWKRHMHRPTYWKVLAAILDKESKKFLGPLAGCSPALYTWLYDLFAGTFFRDYYIASIMSRSDTQRKSSDDH